MTILKTVIFGFAACPFAWGSTTIFYHGHVQALDAAGTRADWLVVKDGKVVRLGNGKAPKERGALRVDLRGRHLLPSLTDAHAHLVDMGEELSQADLRGAKSEKEAVEKLKQFFALHPTSGPLVGNGWDQADWPGQAFPSRASLDSAYPDRPVVLNRIDGHASWVNTAALKQAHLWDAKDPEGGKIARDKEGLPTGMLLDTAQDALDSLRPPYTDEQLENFIRLAVQKSLSFGITTVDDAAAHPRHIEAVRRLLHRGEINFRVYALAHSDKDEELKPLLDRGIEVGAENGRLTVRAVKLFADGAMGSRGAALVEPYSDDPGNRGLLRMTPEEFVAKVKWIDSKGFQIAVHAIGDRGNQVTIDAFEKGLGEKIAEKRPRLEHAQLLREEDLARIAKDGIVASMQPVHCTSDMKWVDSRVGKQRARFAYAWKKLLDLGVPLAFGSDAPVEDINPWHGLFAAVTRQDAGFQPVGGFYPENRISLSEAFRGFTRGAAFSEFEEKTSGSLEVGHWADFMILARDPFKVPLKDLRRMPVEEVYVGGGEGMARLSADLTTWSDGTSFCFEEEGCFRLWSEAFPDGAAAGRFILLSELIQKHVPGPPFSPKERERMMADCLPPERREEAALWLSTLERLRGALLLQPEDVEYCFSTLAPTPKNEALKSAMLAYLDSPLAQDSAAQAWAFLEMLKGFALSLSLGPRLVFVRGLDSRYLFAELAKAFSYVEGIEEVVTCDPWEIDADPGEGGERAGLLVVGPPADSLQRLGENLLHRLDRGTAPARVHLPFQGSTAAQAWLHFFLIHHKIPHRRLGETGGSEPENRPGIDTFVAAIRRDTARELKDRLKLSALLLGDAAGRPFRRQSTEEWAAYFDRLVAAQALAEKEVPYLTSLLSEPAEVAATEAPEAEGVLLSDFGLLPPLRDRVTLGYCEAGLFQADRSPLLLRPGELETLAMGGFAVASAADHRARVGSLLQGFLGRARGRRFLFTPADPGSFPTASRVLRASPRLGRGKPEPEVPFESSRIPQGPRPLSATQLEAYARCPAQYFFANRLRLRRTEDPEGSFPLVFGQATHKALETFFTQHGGDRALLADEARARSLLDEHFRAAVGEIAPLLGDERPLFTILSENFRRLTGKLPVLERQLTELVGTAKPLSLEEDFNLPIGEITLRGKIDRIDQAEDGALLILDYKTGTVDFTPSHIADGSHFQALVYLLAADRLYGKPCTGILFYDLKRGELRRGVLLESRLAPDAKKKITRGHALPEDKLAILKEQGVEQLKTVASAIARGDFTPKPSVSHCATCDYVGHCRGGIGYA